jgi:histidyl-tRNA synthetase
VLARLEGFFPAGVGRRVEGLRQVLALLEARGARQERGAGPVHRRGLDYYTGTVYETFLQDLPGFGAVMSGGRYDGMIGAFAGEEIPAVGISLGIDRLLAGLVELKLVPENRGSVAEVLVTVFDAAHAALSARAAAAIRAGGTNCELYPGPAKLGKQFKYAERRGAKWVVVIGPDDAARGEAQVKDMAAEKQQAVAMAKLAEYLAALRT